MFGLPIRSRRQTCDTNEDRIYDVAFTSIGQAFISQSKDNRIFKLINMEGQCVQAFIGHEGRIFTAAFSPNGQLIASGSEDKKLKLWNLQGRCIKTFPDHISGVRYLAFSPNNQLILSVALNQIKCWNIADGRCLQTLPGPFGSPFTIGAFSPNNQQFFSVVPPDMIGLGNIENVHQSYTSGLHGHKSITAIAVSPDGQLIATLSKDCTLKLWDKDRIARENKPLRIIKPDQGEFSSLAFSPNGQYIVTGTSGRCGFPLRIWRIDGKCLRIFGKPERSIDTILFSPDGQYFATTFADPATGPFPHTSHTGSELWDFASLLATSEDGDANTPEARALLPIARILIDPQVALLQHEIPHDYLCPITLAPMEDPVTTVDGYSYEKNAITQWFTHHLTNPVTNTIIERRLTPNPVLKANIEHWLAQHDPSKIRYPRD